MGSFLLEVRNLTKIFTTGFLKKSRVVAVDDVSFTLPAEKPIVFTIAGESGSGKTTIARLVLGFIKPDRGSIMYDGKDIWEMSAEEWKRYRREVQAIFQDPYGSFNPLHKVDDVFWIPIKRFHLTEDREEAEELIAKSLESVGLRSEEVLGKYPHQLSGGQRQRLMLARAFLIRPRLIVADEPVSMIDASLRANILNLMLSLRDKLKVSYIYITHDLSTAHYVSDEIMILYKGSITEMGDISKVISNPIHPYVRILLESIPIPDPDRRWRDKIVLPKIEEYSGDRITHGCKFFNRCPVKTEQCLKGTPTLTEVESNHWVACFNVK